MKGPWTEMGYIIYIEEKSKERKMCGSYSFISTSLESEH